MPVSPFAVCPSCQSPLLEQCYSDGDLWQSEIVFTDGRVHEPQLSHPAWLGGECEEQVVGCWACGERFAFDDSEFALLESDSVFDELSEVGGGFKAEPYFAQTSTHVARCACGNGCFEVDLVRERRFAAAYEWAADEDDPLSRQLVEVPWFEIEEIYCPNCGSYPELEDLVIEQVAPVIHPDQLDLDI